MAAVLLLSGCGTVEEEGAFVSERTAREVMGSARSLEERGDTIRAAEVYEGLAFGFATQHFAGRALLRAALCREEAALSASGPERAVQSDRALELWRWVEARQPGSQWAAWARYRQGALLAGALGGPRRCGEALVPLAEATRDAALEQEARARARWLRARCLDALGRREEALQELGSLLEAPEEWTEEGTEVPLRVRARSLAGAAGASGSGSDSL